MATDQEAENADQADDAECLREPSHASGFDSKSFSHNYHADVSEDDSQDIEEVDG